MDLYISNLGKQITNDSLWATFATYGEVSSVKLLKEERHNCAFVKMPNHAEALSALSRINGSIIDGMPIAVKLLRNDQEKALGGNRQS